MLSSRSLHHIAFICSDYNKSKYFYTELLGFAIEQEIYRTERDSYKLDLSLNGAYLVELFYFLSPPPRHSRPESTGLRHIAFAVANIIQSIEELKKNGVECEPRRFDEFTNKQFTFFADPDGLLIELYEL